MAVLRIGTRASVLARWQADWVAARLRELGAEVEIVLLSTRGDREQGEPIGGLGGQGLFTKEIQAALLDGRADVAVHSLKDLPTEPVPALTTTPTGLRRAPHSAATMSPAARRRTVPSSNSASSSSTTSRPSPWAPTPALAATAASRPG